MNRGMRHEAGSVVLLVVGLLGALVAAAPGASGGAGSGPADSGGGGPHPLLPAHAEAPPPGHTGGFGEPTCHACHSEYPLNTHGDLEVDGFPERYEAGASYDVTLHLRSDGMERAGFQASVRVLEDPGAGTAAGEAAALDDRVVVQDGGGVPYVQHAPGAAWTDGAETVSWTFRWTAPASAAGAIVLHAAANSANGDESPFGDIVYTAERVSRPARDAERGPSTRRSS